MASSQENEAVLLDQYDDEVIALLEKLREADPTASKNIQKQIDQKLQIFWKQVDLVKTQFPDAVEGPLYEAAYYTHQAMLKLFSAGMMRRVSSGSDNAATAIAAGLIAGQQEKNNARQALTLLDKALGVYDYPSAHYDKALIFMILKQREDALKELSYIIDNFHDDKVYIEARKLKDEIENPPKKGPCFVATACYGDFDHPDVVTFRRWRDASLLPSPVGRAFVTFYYWASPPAAQRIAKTPLVAAFIRRRLLEPLARRLG